MAIKTSKSDLMN